MSRPAAEQGVALITVMVIVAIVASVAAGMLRGHQIDVRRAATVLHGDQAIAHMLAAETWAREVLIKDREDNAYDHLGEDWALNLLPVETDGGSLAGRIRDQQGLFNLNNLVDESRKADRYAMAQFERLVAALEGVDANASALAEAVADWLDTDQEVTGIGGAEDADYVVEDPAYRSAGRPMASPTELLLLRGVTFDLWRAIQPFVTALPRDAGPPTPVNVNTAPPEVLAAVLGVDRSLADEIVAEREDSPFESVGEFSARVESSIGAEAAAEIQFDRFTTISEFFLVESEAQFGEVLMNMRHLIKRDAASTFVLARSLNQSW